MSLIEPVRALAQAGVRFVVVGGLAMTLRGSAAVTTDVDIVYERSPENIKRLVEALARHSPRLRDAPSARRFRFDERSIRNGMNFTLSTELGDIDLLGELTGVGGFSSVKAMSDEVEYEGVVVDLLSLRGLIRAKRAAGRPKDLLVLPELESLAEVEERTERPRRST